MVELKQTGLSEKKGNIRMDQGLIGIEKEQHRVHADGTLSLGKAPFIPASPHDGHVTTDFSESQAELVSSAARGVDETLSRLNHLLIRTHRSLKEDEILWPGSMPGLLPEYADIPLAQTGQTDPLDAFEYRQHLAKRYGMLRMMISGIHLNLSFPDSGWQDHDYLNAARQYLRDRWLMIWLFGASPVVPPTYSRELMRCVPSPWKSGICISSDCPPKIYRHAVSLRMSCFGYPPQKESLEPISFGSLDGYISGINSLVNRGHTLLKESELYLPVRLKRTPRQGEPVSRALRRGGIEYLELRTIDLNPLLPLGIDPDEILLSQLVLFTGVGKPPAPDSRADRIRWNRNHHSAALYGRREGLTLLKEEGGSIPMTDLARRTLDQWEQTALEKGASPEYFRALERARKKVDHPELLPSSRIFEATGEKGENYVSFMRKRAMEDHRYFMNLGDQNDFKRA